MTLRQAALTFAIWGILAGTASATDVQRSIYLSNEIGRVVLGWDASWIVDQIKPSANSGLFAFFGAENIKILQPHQNENLQLAMPKSSQVCDLDIVLSCTLSARTNIYSGWISNALLRKLRLPVFVSRETANPDFYSNILRGSLPKVLPGNEQQIAIYIASGRRTLNTDAWIDTNRVHISPKLVFGTSPSFLKLPNPVNSNNARGQEAHENPKRLRFDWRDALLGSVAGLILALLLIRMAGGKWR